MKPGWEVKPLEKCIEPFKISGKIPRKKFRTEGPYPIISQEADFINGYWADDADLNRVTKPLVIFGDHTQIIKYVDFDFVVGADGVKILQPVDKLNAKFFAYFLEGNPIPSLGYARHFRHIRALEIPIPPLEEQKRIVATLDAAFEGLTRAKDNATANLQNARELFESYLANVFSGALGGWSPCTVGDVLTLQRGFDITKKDQKPGTVPVVSSGGIKSFHNEIRCRAPGVVIGRKGSIGTVHFIKDDYWPHDTTLWVKDFKGNEPRLVSYLLQGIRLSELDTGAANPSLNRNIVHPLEIFWPEQMNQIRIADNLDEMADTCWRCETQYSTKLQDIADLRQSLLQKAFAGELT